MCGEILGPVHSTDTRTLKDTGARILDFIYHIILKTYNHILGMKSKDIVIFYAT